MIKLHRLLAAAVALLPQMASANVAGGGAGHGPDVTVVDHHDGMVTMANGIVSILIDTKKSRLDRVTYTQKNSGSARTSDVLLPAATGRGQYYYGGFSLGSGAFVYALATDPASNGGAYADVKLLSDSEHNGMMEVHFSMLRGSPGFYSTAIMTHRKQDVKFEVGAWGVVTRVTPEFNWLSADRTLVCWPLTPGATSYTLLRSTSRDRQYVPVAAGLIAPVCGSGASVAQYVDATATNGNAYLYKVQSANPAGASETSPPSAATKPSPEQSIAAAPAPAHLQVTGSGHHRVALAWTPSRGASFYRVWRTTLHSDGVGGKYPIGRVLLDDTIDAANFTDTSPTDGRECGYAVEAVNPTGVSVLSASVTARPLPNPPAAAPAALTGHWSKTRNGQIITLTWAPVVGATGYVIYRSSGAAPTFTWPDHYLTAIAETTYVDKGVTDKTAPVKGLDPTNAYDYQVTALNAAGISPPTVVHVSAR